ncbi:MAG: thermonuclease family protein [Desulfamplus sp.]|nr:thermonuclease family protein [Desulfamplus sp.]
MVRKEPVKWFSPSCKPSILLFLSLILLHAPETLSGELFFWTDSQGIRHYSNVAPSSSALNVEIHEENSRKYNAYSPTEQGKITFRTVTIYDGDSMKMEGAGLILMVRMVGIDAPESGRKGVPGQPFSRRAKETLIRMIQDRDLRLKSYGTGGYNRVLAEIFTEDGTNVNLEMVRRGMAEVYRGSPPKNFDITPYNRAEDYAKKMGMGLWSLGSARQSPREWRRANPR